MRGNVVRFAHGANNPCLKVGHLKNSFKVEGCEGGGVSCKLYGNHIFNHVRCMPGGTSTLCKPSTAHLQIIRQSLRGTGTHTFFSPSLSLCISLSRCTVQLLDSTQDAECHLRGKSSLSPLRAPLICRVGWSSSKSSGAHLSLGASLSVLLSVCV